MCVVRRRVRSLQGAPTRRRDLGRRGLGRPVDHRKHTRRVQAVRQGPALWVGSGPGLGLGVGLGLGLELGLELGLGLRLGLGLGLGLWLGLVLGARTPASAASGSG